MNTLYSKFKDLEQEKINEAFVESCINGNLEEVKYLLTSPELKFKADLNDPENEALDFACVNNHIEIIKYLLNSPELKFHANKNSIDGAFKSACYYGNSQIVEYLIYDANIPYSDNIKSFLDMPNQDATLKGAKIDNPFQSLKGRFLDIKNTFEARELEKELTKNNIKNKKSKI